MNKKDALTTLYLNRYLTTEKEFDLFEESLNIIKGNMNLDDISSLLSTLEDETDNDSVMYTLIHLIESYSKFGIEEYVNKILEEIYMGCLNGRKWLMLLFNRMFNSSDYFKIICSCIKENFYDLDDFEEVLEEMKNQYPKNNELIDIVLSLIHDEDVDYECVNKIDPFREEIYELEELYSKIDRNSPTYFEDSNIIMDKESELLKKIKGNSKEKELVESIKALRKPKEKFLEDKEDTTKENLELPKEFLEGVVKLAELQKQMYNLDYSDVDIANKAMKLGMDIGNLNMKLSMMIMKYTTTDPTNPIIEVMSNRLSDANTNK